MAYLETTYMGLKLKNPLIAASSGLTNSLNKILELEAEGIGAVVLKSLFEEQINNEATHLLSMDSSEMHYPEADDYIKNYVRDNNVQNYLELIRQVKNSCSIPIIASINCLSSDEWVGFAKEIENAGADALELNAFIVPTSRHTTSESLELEYIKILNAVKKEVSIPVAMKIGMNFTNLIGFVDKLYAHGASAVVMFNRFYEPDIDVDKLKIVGSEIFSSPSDLTRTLRWTGIISSAVKNIEIAASTGIHDGEAVIKELLAGAKVTEICSTLYLNGPAVVGEILTSLKDFMKKWNFHSIDDFRGRLSYKSIPDSAMYERAQFMKYFSKHA